MIQVMDIAAGVVNSALCDCGRELEEGVMTAGSTSWISRVFGVSALALCVGWGMPATGATKFSKSSVDGYYGGTLNGFITQVDEQALPLPVSTASATVIRADGNGNFPNVYVTYNVGGCVILDLRGSGTYDVLLTGLGTATVELKTFGRPLVTGACDPTTLLPPIQTAEFVFEFTVNRSVPDADQILDGIGLTFTANPDTAAESIVGFTGDGAIRRQER